MVRPAFFFDRDGVLNKPIIRNGKPFAPRKLSDFELYPGIERCLNEIAALGFLNFVITNQPDVGHKIIDEALLLSMHAPLEKMSITEIFICPHRQDEGCFCRKPNPGMLFGAAESYNVDLRQSYVVGDRVSDLVAGVRANCTPLFIDRSYRETPILFKKYSPEFENKVERIVDLEGAVSYAKRVNKLN